MLRKSPQISLFVISSILVGYVSCVGFYTIVAPEHVRPNLDYQVSITLHNQVEPTKIRLSIEDGIKYKNQKEVNINSNQTELVTLRIGDLDVNNGYKFVAEGLSGIIFKNESALKVESKNVSLFIQTDKAIYKPGDTIKFRVVVLGYDLRPISLASDSLLNIYLNDPEKNRIKQWLKVTPRKGVFSSEIQLSELPVLGGWKFTAEVGNEKKIKEIEVAEYVLPKFDVSIDAPADFSAKDGKIRAIIRSKYTYGKLVKGEAIVSLTPSQSMYYYHGSDTQNRDSILKTIPINGKGSVEFDVEEDLKLEFGDYQRSKYFEMRATVIEELTGRNQSATKDVTIHQTRYKFQIPGIPKKFSLSISHHDDSRILLNDETKWVTVGKIIDRYNANENVTYFKFELNENGTAEIRIPTSVKDVNFYLEVKYMSEESDLGYFYPFTVPEPAELEAIILTKRPTLNKDVFVEVQSSHLLQNFTYQVIAHSKVIYAGSVEVPNRNYHVFRFLATFDLAPKATIIVYRFVNDEIVATKTDITIEDDLNNFIKLKLSKAEVQPGKDVNIDIITKAASHVGLVGVDQSVLLLKKNPGLTKEDAFEEMNKYQDNFYEIEKGPWDVPRERYIQDYFSYFERCNTILFTNAKHDVYKMTHRVYYSAQSFKTRGGYAQPVAISGVAPEAQYYSTTFNAVPKTEMDYSASSNAVEPPRIRKEFPETWLWEDFDINNANGTTTLVKQVPDTITSWVISAFSIDPITGLGLTKNPRTLNVFQPFFVSLNLPYSVKRGEVVSIPVVLFNYLESDLDAELTIHNENGDFEFVDDNETQQTSRKRHLTVASNNGVNANFIVKFNSVGQIPIKVTATSPIAGDAIERLLLVEPEGIPQFINKAIFVDLRESNKFDALQNVQVPENAVDGSLSINVNAIGDLLGGTIQNLQQLIRLPTGCGEQNMLKFVPNIVVLDYLKAANNLQPAIEKKAIKFLISGYQRELTYRHRDGSFSSFGKWDRKGSTWLTAFVAKSFKQAEKYIDIDSSVTTKALDWLSSIQKADGSFPEVGQISHEIMQGGSAKGIALTAYTAIAFLRNQAKGWNHTETVNKAINYIATNVKDIDNTYAKSIAAYALQLANYPTKDEVLDSLVDLTITKDHQKWWTRENKPNVKQSKSINIEITSYGFLALIEAKRFAEALPYFKWLLAQRNDQGGFVGTQDTVIGLEALAKYAEQLSTKSNNVQMKIQADNANDTFLNVNAENALLLQRIDLSATTKSVHLSATGHGFALFQLSYRYNLLEKDIANAFELKVKVTDFKPGHLTVQVCSSYNQDDKPSNMVIYEVGMPSGFIIEKDKLSLQLSVAHAKLVETKQGETVANIYFDQLLPHVETCVEVQGYRSHKVAETKPVPVRVYDYYDSSKSAKDFYEIPSVTSCDICEKDECSKSCKK